MRCAMMENTQKPATAPSGNMTKLATIKISGWTGASTSTNVGIAKSATRPPTKKLIPVSVLNIKIYCYLRYAGCEYHRLFAKLFSSQHPVIVPICREHLYAVFYLPQTLLAFFNRVIDKQGTDIAKPLRRFVVYLTEHPINIGVCSSAI